MRLAVCWKVVAHPAPAGDEPPADTRWVGVSPADEAALEVALFVRDLAGAATVAVVAVGPATADQTLRGALAAGADEAIRIDADIDTDGSVVADALAAVLGDAAFVWCGDYSLDRGTGSVPAYLAGRLGAAQALGLVGVDLESYRPGGPLRVVRRLDGGRREILDVTAPAVLSVEGSVAQLRRAALAASLAARTAPVRVIPGPTGQLEPEGIVTAYRPRARVLPPPAGGTLDRVRDLLDAGGHAGGHAETVALEPADAAARIVAQLRDWGYLEGDGGEPATP